MSYKVNYSPFNDQNLFVEEPNAITDGPFKVYRLKKEASNEAAARLIQQFLEMNRDKLLPSFQTEDACLIPMLQSIEYLIIRKARFFAAASLAKGCLNLPIHSDYKDLFTQIVLENPVQCSRGHYLEKERVEHWIQHKGNICPDGKASHPIMEKGEQPTVDVFCQMEIRTILYLNLARYSGEISWLPRMLERTKNVSGGPLKMGGKIAIATSQVTTQQGARAAAQVAFEYKIQPQMVAQRTIQMAQRVQSTMDSMMKASMASAKASAELASKTVEKGAAKQVATTVTKTAVETTAKAGEKGAAKGVATKLPLIGLAISVGFATYRLLQGQYGRAAAEVTSGAASCVPGGWMASLAIDALVAGYDISEALAQSKKRPLDNFYRFLGINPDENPNPSRQDIDEACEKINRDVLQAKRWQRITYSKDEMLILLETIQNVKNTIYEKRGFVVDAASN